jgi:hypothetical protein
MLKHFSIFMLLFFVSCSTDVKILKIHNDFVYDNFSIRKFYITPVINNTKIPPLDEADIRLERAFQKEKKHLLVYGADFTLSKIRGSNEPDILSDIIKNYRQNNEFNIEKIISLSKYLGDGFIIFSIIDNFFIREREYNESHVISDGKNSIDSVNEHVTEVKSTIEGSFYIFELKTGKLFFNVEHVKSEINSESRTERDCFDSCLFGFIDDIFNFGPTPYGANDMSEYFFKDIIKSIPNKGEKIKEILKKDNRFELK